jgi:hypothetical protein
MRVYFLNTALHRGPYPGNEMQPRSIYPKAVVLIRSTASSIIQLCGSSSGSSSSSSSSASEGYYASLLHTAGVSNGTDGTAALEITGVQGEVYVQLQSLTAITDLVVSMQWLCAHVQQLQSARCTV